MSGGLNGMHMSEQLPDSVIGTVVTKERIVIQIDFLVVYLDIHLHCHRLKSCCIIFPKVSQIVVSEYQVNLPIQPVKNSIPFCGITQTKIAKMKHDIVCSDDLVPVCNQRLIHRLYIHEWSSTKVDDIRMIKVGVGCKEYAVSIEFVQ